jgi:hypothetical protein
VDGSPVIGGAIYISQDHSSQEIKTINKEEEDAINDLKVEGTEDVPTFVRELKKKYGSSHMAQPIRLINRD